jgi:hypothetical protein
MAQNINMRRAKCSALFKNVLCAVETEKIIKNLQKNIISILLDESTDVSIKKQLVH